MVIIIFGWLYFFIWVLSFGNAAHRLLEAKFNRGNTFEYPFPRILLTLLLGFAFISAAGSALSIFFPVDLGVHLFLLGLAVLCFWVSLSGIRRDTRYIIQKIRNTPVYLWLVALPVFFLILLYASDAPVYNLDSSRYHLPNIHWTEQYKAIPGLVLIQDHVAFESNWWILHAVFDVGPFQHGSFHVLNSFLLVGLLLIGIIALGGCIRNGITVARVIWIITVAFFFDFRNSTAYWDISSASPDPLVWVLWLFNLQFLVYVFSARAERHESPWMLLAAFVALASFGLTAKLSAVMLGTSAIVFAVAWLLVQPHGLSPQRMLKPIGMLFALAFFLSAGHLARKVITTGYPFYPLSLFGGLSGDWKIPVQEADLIRTILDAGQKLPHKAEVEQLTNPHLPFDYWFRGWLDHSLAHSTLLWGMVGFLLLCCTLVWKQGRDRVWMYKWVLVCLGIGLLFWFTNAPNPRFANSLFLFLFAFGGSAVLHLLPQAFSRWMPATLGVLLSVKLFVYFLKMSPLSLSQNHVKYPVVFAQMILEKNALLGLKPAPAVPYVIDSTSVPGLQFKEVQWDLEYRQAAFAPTLTFEGNRAHIVLDMGPKLAYASRRNYYMIYPAFFTPLPSGQRLVRKGIRMRGTRLEDGFRLAFSEVPATP